MKIRTRKFGHLITDRLVIISTLWGTSYLFPTWSTRYVEEGEVKKQIFSLLCELFMLGYLLPKVLTSGI